MNALICPEDDGKGCKPDLIVYEGGYIMILINDVKRVD